MDKPELFRKVRLYMVEHSTDAFTSSLVEGEISRYDVGISTLDLFKINVDLLLQINIDNL